MSTPYIGQIQSFGFGIIPRGWAACNGQMLAIAQNQALYALLGTQFGGNGVTTFALPNLQGSFAMHQASAIPMGQAGGEANHTLTAPELATHTHSMLGSSATASQASPGSNYPGSGGGTSIYNTATNTILGSGSSPAGGGQPHPNMPPYLAMNYCIALQGVFPPRS